MHFRAEIVGALKVYCGLAVVLYAFTIEAGAGDELFLKKYVYVLKHRAPPQRTSPSM